MVPCDLTDARQCEQAAAATSDAFGRIDILVNVAGGSGPIGKTGVETTPDEFDEIVTLNMNGCFHTMRAVLPAMMAQRYGKIVNVGGTFGMRGRAGRMAYSASKWGLRGITKSFALEVGAYNINVNCVAPGMVDGPRFRDKVCADMAKKLGITVEQAVERHAADYALKRVTTDADVANACLFLASDVRARSPASTFRSMAAGPCCEEPTMTRADLVIRGGKVVSPDSVIEASVAIKDGRIIAVGADAACRRRTETLDARGCTCCPARSTCTCISAIPAIRTRRTSPAARRPRRSAASPPCSTCRTRSRRPARRKFSPPSSRWPRRRPMSISASMRCSARTPSSTCRSSPRRAIGFKLYMGNTFGKIRRPRPARCWRRSRWWRRPASASRCMPRPTRSWSAARRGCAQAGRIDPLAHIASRPAVVAVEAVSRAAILAEWTGARIHILHISSAEELRPLREAKARGVDITGETCPHYLLLSTDDYARFAGVIRVNPPVREERNQEPLWAALADGTIDMIATDHAPHSPEEKTRNDIWTVDCGFPGVETQMPLMLTEVNAGRFSILRLRALERRQPREDLGALSAQGRHPARRRRRHRRGRSRRANGSIDDAKLQSLSQDHAVARPPREGPADPHAGARPLRDEGPRAPAGHARLRPLGARDPADAGAAAAEHRPDHGCDRQCRSAGRTGAAA